MEEKMFMCYGIRGYNQVVYSNPREGSADPDEIDVVLSPDVTMEELKDGSRCLFYKDIPYSDYSLSFVNNNIVSHRYKSGDEYDRPTGGLIILATLKK